MPSYYPRTQADVSDDEEAVLRSLVRPGEDPTGDATTPPPAEQVTGVATSASVAAQSSEARPFTPPPTTAHGDTASKPCRACTSGRMYAHTCSKSRSSNWRDRKRKAPPTDPTVRPRSARVCTSSTVPASPSTPERRSVSCRTAASVDPISLTPERAAAHRPVSAAVDADGRLAATASDDGGSAGRRHGDAEASTAVGQVSRTRQSPRESAASRQLGRARHSSTA